MSSMLRKTIGLAVASILMLAPLSFAAGPGGTTGAGQQTPGATGTQPGMQPGMAGMHSSFQATVQEIDREDGKLKLRSADGETMDLKVPQQVLTGLQQGDRVQVAIQKAGERAPGTPGTTPGAGPGTSPGASPGSPGTSPAQPR